MKKCLSVILAVMLLTVGVSAFAEGQRGPGGRGGMGGGSADKSSDAELQAMITEIEAVRDWLFEQAK